MRTQVGQRAATVPVRSFVGRGEGALPRHDALKEARVSFFFLLVFTVLLYGRPEDVLALLRDLPMARVVAVCAAISYLLNRLQGRSPFIWSTEIKLVFGLTFLFTLGVPFSFWRSNSLTMLVSVWLKTVVIFILITQTASTLERIRKLLWVMILCELFISALSIESLGGIAVQYDVRVGGVTVGFVSGNYLGIAVATTLPYMTVLLLRSRSVIKSLLLVATFGLLMWMVALSASRGNLLSVLASLLLNWVYLIRRTQRGRVLAVVFASLVLLAVFSAPGIFWERISTMWVGPGRQTSEQARSAQESQFQRRSLLRRSIQYTLENPFFGVGLGNFAIVSGSKTRQAGEWKVTHNTFTQVSSEAGIPAFLLFVGMLIISLRRMRRITRECSNQPELEEAGLLARATTVSLLSFMFGGFFVSLAYDYYLYYLVGLGVALQVIMRNFQGQGAVTSTRMRPRIPAWAGE